MSFGGCFFQIVILSYLGARFVFGSSLQFDDTTLRSNSLLTMNNVPLFIATRSHLTSSRTRWEGLIHCHILVYFPLYINPYCTHQSSRHRGTQMYRSARAMNTTIRIGSETSHWRRHFPQPTSGKCWRCVE